MTLEMQTFACDMICRITLLQTQSTLSNVKVDWCEVVALVTEKVFRFAVG